jgi:tyrosyl-tRNA synthetase
MFQARLRAGADIHMHEMIYPILQGYDSVALRSDLTIIGTDQLYNEMLGRFYQERMGQAPQVIITTKITPGLDGQVKQSKSRDNYIGLGHSPRDKYGRLMTLPDALIPAYLRVYTDLPLERIAAIEERLPCEPLACKRLLAHEIVRRYHGVAVADEEQAWFIATFSARQAPSDMPELCVAPGVYPALELVRRHFGAQLGTHLGAQRSTSDLRRLFRQRAITLNGATITQPDEPITARDGAVFQVGKRVWFRLRVAPSSSLVAGDDGAG